MSENSSLFRSELMSLIQLYIPTEIATTTVAELGDLGVLQCLDLNEGTNAFQRAFVGEIRRLDEMERKLRFLRSNCDKASVLLQPYIASSSYARIRSQQEIDELETRLTEHEVRISQMNNSQETLKKRFLELTELRHVLRETAHFFDEAESRQEEIVVSTSNYDSYPPLLGNDRDPASLEVDSTERGEIHRNTSIGFVAGVIERTRMISFERILWRALRGNLYMNYAEIADPITDPITDQIVQKNVFIIFAHGNQLINKIRKISESMGATLYPVDSNPDKRREDAIEVIARIEDLNNVLHNTNQTQRAELIKVAEHLNRWEDVVYKEKAIYYTMNLFNYDQNRKCLIGEGWVPSNSIASVQYALRSVTERTASTIPPILSEMRTKKEPPTFHRTNKVTKGFQAIVDAYGISTYREVNPGLFTVITFPFLFAVMFGDLGHGFLMSLFAGWMCWKEKELAKKKDWGEIWDTTFGGRYLILLMGLFSMYTGLIYNDIFSKGLELFPEGWHFEKDDSGNRLIGHRQTYDDGTPVTYAFGIDPAWHGSENNLLFSNSYKMKMAIILGVIHMSFGITLQVCNHKYFKKPISIWGEFIPQILFLWSIFGYLCFMVIYKWLAVTPNDYAPDLLKTLIYMFLSPGTLSGPPLFTGQAAIQSILLLVAFICVPWMLLTKPLYLRREMKRTAGAGYSNVSTDNLLHQNDGPTPLLSEIPANGSMDSILSGSVAPQEGVAVEEMHSDENHDFGDIMVHQIIHTIEFCLGAISNTASYLRLWALSLAHAQLSEVLWERIMQNVYMMQNPILLPIALFIAFSLWFSLTVFILLIMEGLSAFLHALRLHWVEFNNKFFMGTGTRFIPFSFDKNKEDE